MPKPHRRQARHAATADAPATPPRLPEVLALASADDLVARFGELATETPGGPLALVEALGGERSDAAARVLSTLAAEAPDRELRKAARRGLHRLRAVGLSVDIPAPSTAPAPTAAPELPRLADAHATTADGVGSRALWLVLERPLGGLAVFGLLLNDLVGMKDCTFRETTRKKFRETLRDWHDQNELPSHELSPDYGLALVSEALALNAESGQTVPTEFQLHRALLGALPPPPENALIHRYVTRGQALLLPDLLEQTDQLLDEEELQPWFFSYDESIARAEELRRIREARIVLSIEPREVQERRVIDAAVADLFTPKMRRAIRRRLEEVAYLFWTTGRERAARRAVAAAFALNESSLARHPFARALVVKSLELALEAQRAGLDPTLLRRTPYDDS